MNAIPSSATNPLRPCFRPRRLGHANLFVGNYERAFEFYNQVAGFEEVYRQPDVPASFISNGNTYHDFGLTDLGSRYAPPGQAPGVFHIAFELETEVDLVDGYRASLAQGIEFAFCQNHDVAHSLYKYDPDGNMVEVYADVFEDWRAARNGVISGQKPEWIPGETTVPVADPRYPKNPQLRTVTSSVFRGRRVTHVSLVAQKYEEMLAYYTCYLGLQQVAGSAGGDWVLLGGTASDSALTLYRAGPGRAPGFHHVGIEVGSEADLDRALALLPRDGVEVEHQIDHPVRRAITILDPDGIRLQFYVDRDWSAQRLAGVALQDALYLL
ncbi:VOC family protein [Ramlibacter tataouinensis]|uniref:VOC family protein n=1 Tax=Ramlibacter tataouinensis TaxID=94132 RepID=UPI0022F3CB00|nr:VOC family protein [Ramlibacter tataouinensis]WBY02379.1 VOC family protein [Ramlibacter tataouinensis]